MIKEIKGEDFRKMQLTELDMLVEFDKVCRKYNINYVLFGGSLLGAVRHQGYIPWDDDVDIMMPRMDGITMMMKVREKGYDFPVIMLSAKSEEVDKIMGLNMGADDYITKPFTPLELLARVNSHLRRYNRYREAIASAEPVKDTYHVLGGIELNEETVEVFVDGAPVRLTPIEFKILLLLMRNPGRVFSADEIYERIWNEKAVNTDTIMVHVRKIREKIEIDPKNPKYLKVVWGVGYKMEKQ